MTTNSQNILSQDNTIKPQTILMIDGHRVQLNFLMEPYCDNLDRIKALLLRSCFDGDLNAEKI